MNNKFYKLMMITLLLFSFKHIQATVVTDTAAAANLTTCLAPSLVRYQFTVSSSGSTGAYLDIRLPNGFTYAGLAYGPLVTGGSGSNTITYSGVVAGRHRFTFGSSVANQSIRFGIRQLATCNAGNGSYTGRDSSFFFEGSGSTFNAVTNTFNVTSPDLSITGVSTSPNPTNALSTVSRTFTINNGGFGATRNFIAVDRYGANNVMVNTSSFVINPAGVNFSIPSAYITTTADSLIVRFDSVLCQQIGDLDQLFENGESFILQYQLQLKSCGNSSNIIVSTLRTGWRCNTTTCNFSNSSNAVSVNVPAAPVLSYKSMVQRDICFDGTSLMVDTVRVINTGGIARNYVITINDLYIDTSNVYFRVGRYGILNKIKVLGGSRSTACGLTGNTSIRLDTIDVFNTNDTIWFMVNKRMNYCRPTLCYNATGGANFSSLPGIEISATFSNACNNLAFITPLNTLINSSGGVSTMTYASKADISCGESMSLIFDAGFSYNTLNNRRLREFEITLPPELMFDTVAGRTVYFRTGASIRLPSARPSANIFRFNTNNPGDKMFINIKSVNASDSCSGPKRIKIVGRINPDTGLLCHTFYHDYCINYDILWYACTSCDTLGLSMFKLSAWRKNFDINDPADNGLYAPGRPDTTLIARTSYMLSDTMLLNSKVVAITTSTNPMFEYAYFKTGLRGGASNWSHVSTTVRHWGPSTTLSVINVNPIFSGDSVRWDLSALPNILNNDTIILTSQFRVIASFSFTGSASNETRWYASRVANPSISQQLGLPNTRGKVFALINAIGSQTLFYGVTAGTGCTQRVWTNVMRYGNVSDPFPFEIRPMSYIGRTAFAIPEGFTINRIDLRASRFGGQNNPAISNIPFTVVGDSMIVDFAPYFQINGGILPFLTEGHELVVEFSGTPGCRSSAVARNYGLSVYQYLNKAPAQNGRRVNGTFVNIQSTMANFVLSSSNPTVQAYAPNVSWPIRITNSTSFNAPNSYVYLNSISGNIIVDSVYRGSTRLTAVNGFYQIGNIAGAGIVDLVVYASNFACGLDSLQVNVGFNCIAYPTVFTSNICGNPRSLYVQAQPAIIASLVTSLSATPIDPSNASSSTFGSNSVTMCKAFPVQIEVQSTQSGSLFNIRERINLPLGTNGTPGLDYVSDSGYIEYPIGSTPRAFSTTANTAILGQVSTGAITLSLEQIDPSNFSSTNGLLGTGSTANPSNRSAILRFKMRPNCNLISGNSWTYTQLANSPCGAVANGNNISNSGFAVNLNGVTTPYLTTVALQAGNVSGYGNNTPVRIKTEKVGATAPSSSDSFTLVIPTSVRISTINCNGAFCPSGTVTPVISQVGANRVYKWRYPITAGNTGDTLNYTFNMTAADKTTCMSNLQLKVDLLQRANIYCGAVIPANLCPNSYISLGSSSKLFDLVKPIFTFTSYNNEFLPRPSLYTYRFAGVLENSSSIVSASSGVTLNTYFDVNNNLIYEKGIDDLVKTTVIGSSINAGASNSFIDSFVNINYQPSPNLPLYTVIDTSDAISNCFCSSTGFIATIFNQALPTKFITATVEKINNNKALIEWQIDVSDVKLFNIYKLGINQSVFVKVGTVKAIKNILIYSYIDDISKETNSETTYYIEAIDFGNKSFNSQILQISNSNNSYKNETVFVYPNPANDFLEIKVQNKNKNIKEIKMIDINGKIILIDFESSNQIKINLENYNQGLYNMIIQFKNGESIIKKLNIIKN